MENIPEEKKSDKPSKNPEQKLAGALMLEAGIEFAFLIGGPLIAGVWAGQWLDNKFHHNFFIIIGIFTGLTISVVAISKRIDDYKKILKINK